MTSRSLFFSCFFSAVCFTSVHSQAAQIWLTTGDGSKRLNRQADLQAGGRPVGGHNVDVDRGQQFQDIKGFGAALSNSASWLLWNSFERETVLNDLFNPSQGIGLSYVRLVMGGSDFNAVSPYTYDDAGFPDFNHHRFSIDKDRQFVIPVIKEILRINPEVRIMASPWSAPAWMKNSGTLYGGQILSAPKYLQSYAEYFVRFVRAYEAEGIRIDTITLQNEPEHATNGYPTMLMPWYVQRDLIRYHVGPRFRQEGITTEIIIWDHNWGASWYPLKILNDPEAKSYIAGSAWHCYVGNRYDPISVTSAHPDKDIYFTQCSGGEWDTNFGSVLGWNLQNLFIGQTRIGARTVLLWNLALDQNHGPRVKANGCTNCRGVITVRTDGPAHEKNVEYFILGHLSKFVRPGARRIMSTTYEAEEFETVAFQNPDGSAVVVVVNLSWSNSKSFQIVIDGAWYYYDNLPTRSAITFVK